MPVAVHTGLHSLSPSEIYGRFFYRSLELRDLAVAHRTIDIANPYVTAMAEVRVGLYMRDLLPSQRLTFFEQLDEFSLSWRSWV